MDRFETVRRLAVVEGLPCKAIARKMTCNYYVVYRRMVSMGILGQRQHLRETQLAEIEKLIRSGELNYSQIGKQYGRGRLAILRIAKRIATEDAKSDEPQEWPSDSSEPEIDFTPISFHRACFCERCNRMITVKPCVACAARDEIAAKRNTGNE